MKALANGYTSYAENVRVRYWSKNNSNDPMTRNLAVCFWLFIDTHYIKYILEEKNRVHVLIRGSDWDDCEYYSGN